MNEKKDVVEVNEEEQKKTQNNACGGPSPSPVSSGRRITFREAMSISAKQINLDGFLLRDRGEFPEYKYIWVQGDDYKLANTLCMVMSEVYMAAPHHVMYVGGIAMEADQIQTVYRELTHDHVVCLIGKIKNSKGNVVKYQRPYMRTMLYNIVFEYEVQIQAGMDADSWEV